MKNQVENENKNNESHEFIYCIADLIGTLYISLLFIEQHIDLWSKKRA